MVRGAIELFPVIGVLICIIADVIATRRLPESPNSSILPDATPCG